MKRLAVILMGIFVITGLTTGQAQAKKLKIAYVNVQRIVSEVSEAKNAREKLRSDFKTKQEQLNDMQKEFEQAMADFEKKKHMMKPEVRIQTEAQLKQKYSSLHQTLTRLQSELAEQEAAMARDIHKKIRKLVEAIGDRDGYSLILDNSEMKGTVLYFKRHLDITDQVIKMYNVKYPSKG